MHQRNEKERFFTIFTNCFLFVVVVVVVSKRGRSNWSGETTDRPTDRQFGASDGYRSGILPSLPTLDRRSFSAVSQSMQSEREREGMTEEGRKEMERKRGWERK